MNKQKRVKWGKLNLQQNQKQKILWIHKIIWAFLWQLGRTGSDTLNHANLYYWSNYFICTNRTLSSIANTCFPWKPTTDIIYFPSFNWGRGGCPHLTYFTLRKKILYLPCPVLQSWQDSIYLNPFHCRCQRRKEREVTRLAITFHIWAWTGRHLLHYQFQSCVITRNCTR